MEAPATAGIKVLILEDAPADAELAQHMLRKHGLGFTARVVGNRKDFRAALSDFQPDIVLSDYHLPDMNGLDALALAHAYDSDLPVITVTGVLGDEAAAQLLRAGARDYVLKDRLARLPEAVLHALEEARAARTHRLAQQALALSEAKFRDLVETSPDWIWEIDIEGRLIYSSPQVETILGYAPEALIGRVYLSLVKPSDAQHAAELFRKSVAGAASFHLEKGVMLAKDGREVTLESSGRPVFAPGGILGGWRGISRDVTARELAERDRLRQAAILAGVQETSVDGILLIDPQGQVVLHNQRFAEIFRLPKGQFASPSDESLLAAALPLFVDPDAFLARVKELYAQPDATSRDEIALTDGRTLDRYSAPVTLPDGSHIGRVWFFRDITERKQVEESLRSSQQLLRSIIDTIPVRVFWKDRNLVYLGCNAVFARDAGVAAPQDLVGKDDTQLVWRDEAAHYRADDRGVIDSGTPKLLIEETQTTPAGETITLLTSKQPLRSAKGEIEGVLGVYMDITERKRAERKIREDEARFRALTEQGLAGVYIIDHLGNLAYLNPPFQRVLGYESEELFNRPFTDHFREGDRARVMQVFRESLEEKKQVRGDWGLIRKDGSTMDIISQGGFATLEDQPVVMGVILDVTELKASERARERLNRALRTLSRGNEAVVHARTIDELLNSMCAVLVETGGFAMAWYGAVQFNERKSILPMAWAGKMEDFAQTADFSWADRPDNRTASATAVITGATQVIQDVSQDPEPSKMKALAAQYGIRSGAVFPLKDESGVFAILAVYAHEANSFDEDCLSILRELVGDLAFGIKALQARAENRDYLDRLIRSMEGTIEALASTVEVRDPYTAGHQRQVADLAIAIAREIKLPEETVRGLYLAATVHDVGKIQVPLEILNKPGRLSKQEFELVKAHVSAGYELLKNAEFSWPIAEIVLQHHERLDGSGYPRGLAGDQILVQAKILAVADVVEAMTSHRPYRPALGVDKALEEIERGKQKLYDAQVVDACVKLIRSGAFKFDRTQAG